MWEIKIKFNKCGEQITVFMLTHIKELWIKDRKVKRNINKLFEIITIKELE